jgi:DNA mismatch repair protein MutL
VHPAKREVRFRDEAKVRNFIIEAVLSVLRAKMDEGLVAPVQAVSASLPVVPVVPVVPAPISVVQPSNPISAPSVVPAPLSAPVASVRLGWRLLGRLRSERAIFETPTGVAILDIGAAHQRVLYEKILEQFNRQQIVSQPLLVPLTLELEPLAASVLKERAGLLASAGFDFEEYGRNFWRVAALPFWLEPEEALAFIRDLLAEMARREGDFGKPSLAYDALAKLAVIRARRKGDALADQALMELVQSLFRTTQPGTCPKGHKTYWEWSEGEMARRFS